MFYKIAEEKIKEAIENGEFDDLPGKGRFIDLTDYFNTPEHLRIAYSLLKNSNFIPEEVQLRKEIGEMQEQLAQLKAESERGKLIRRINEKLRN